MIERFNTVKWIAHDVHPTILFTQRARLGCGCFVVVGKRADNGEAATATCPCSEAHHPMMEGFHRAFEATLPTTSTRPAIEVVDELLHEAERRAV